MSFRVVLRAERKPSLDSASSRLDFLRNYCRQDSPNISKSLCDGPEIETYRSDFLNFQDCSVDSAGSSCCCFDLHSLEGAHLSCKRNNLDQTLCSALFYPFCCHRVEDCSPWKLAASFLYLTGHSPSRRP